MSARRWIRLGLYCVAVAMLLYAGNGLLGYHKEAGASGSVTQELQEMALAPAEPTATPAAPEESLPAEEPPLEAAPFTVDFDLLRTEGKDIVAWLYCEDTPINYPIVQGEDNEFYVEHLPDGTHNGFGTLFLDFINEPDFSDFNSIIYGHNMLDDSMFGVVTEYNEQTYFEDHPLMYLMTPEQYYRMELVGGVILPINSWFYNLDYMNPEKREAFVRQLKEESTFASAAEFSVDDRFADLEGKVVWICLWASWCP